MNIDLSSVFSFYLSKPSYGKSYKDYATAQLTLKATGTLLTPKKEFKFLKEVLEQLIK